MGNDQMTQALKVPNITNESESKSLKCHFFFAKKIFKENVYLNHHIHTVLLYQDTKLRIRILIPERQHLEITV